MTPRRIALLKPSALGDICHALPVLSALRRRFPDAHLTWVVNRAYEPLLAGHPDLDATLPFDRGAFRRGPVAAARYAARFAGDLRRRRFDLVIDLQGLLRTGLMCAATGAPRKVGFADAREGAARFYTHRVAVPDADRTHAVERYWRVARAVGCDGPLAFRLPVRPAEADAVRREFAGLPRPWLALAVGSRWATKCWPPESFAALAGRAQAAFGGTVLFVGTADDTALSVETGNRLPGPWRDLSGRTTLPRLAAVLAAADAVVGNDTGPLHLAAALGVPCVAPYTCTRVTLHGPYTSMAGGVETRVACGGSYRKTCGNMICMPELTPDRLWPRLAEVLDAWQRTRSRSA
jgi:lipopolysaccharide heptosyltransferase I